MLMLWVKILMWSLALLALMSREKQRSSSALKVVSGVSGRSLSSSSARSSQPLWLTSAPHDLAPMSHSTSNPPPESLMLSDAPARLACGSTLPLEDTRAAAEAEVAQTMAAEQTLTTGALAESSPTVHMLGPKILSGASNESARETGSSSTCHSDATMPMARKDSGGNDAEKLAGRSGRRASKEMIANAKSRNSKEDPEAGGTSARSRRNSRESREASRKASKEIEEEVPAPP